MKHPFGLDVPPHDREPVAWFAPVGLRRIAREQLWSLNLVRNLDRRETFRGEFELVDLSGQADADGGFWMDFVADTGDGGNATTTVAQAMLAPHLQAEGAQQPLPEARLMVMGGDLAYPGASPQAYQSRLIEMFELAAGPGRRFRPVPPRLRHDSAWQPDQKIVAAIAQNHDWMDSAATFSRTFVNDEKAGLVGARAPQRRTYFAFALPHDWALLGFDFALTGDLDRAQFEAFEAMIADGRIHPGMQLILVYPQPFWTRPFERELRPAYPYRYQRLEHRLLTHGCSIRLRLAGDLHHYARDRLEQAPPQALSADLVTCGSGGAFGHGTHTREAMQTKVMQLASEPAAAQEELRGRVLLGRVAPRERAEAQGLAFSPDGEQLQHEGRARSYPPPEQTWRAAWANLVALLGWRDGRVDLRNIGFALVVGALMLMAGAAAADGMADWMRRVPAGTWPGGSVAAAWMLGAVSQPWSVAAHLLLMAGAAMLATDNDPLHAEPGDRFAAAVLAVLQWPLVALLHKGLLVPLLGSHWPALPQGGTAAWAAAAQQAVVVVLAAWIVASVAAGLGVGLFLAVMSAVFGRLINNAASALASEDHKGFVRLRIGAQGATVFMLGCDRVPRRWVAAPPGQAPRWRPAPGQPAPSWRVVDRFEMPAPPAPPAPPGAGV